MLDSHHRWWSSSTIRLNLMFIVFIKPHVLWSLFSGTPPKTPPPNFPPRVQNLAIFGTPPGPPLFCPLLPPKMPLFATFCAIPVPCHAMMSYFDTIHAMVDTLIKHCHHVMTLCYHHNDNIILIITMMNHTSTWSMIALCYVNHTYVWFLGYTESSVTFTLKSL